MATLKINGKEIIVEDGTLILQAAKVAGFEIPTMCYHARLSRLASCRVCLVEIVGQRKLQPACATPVIHGMEVLTETPLVKSTRSAMIELLLANHPLDCPVCDKGGECELQDVTFKFGPRKSPFGEWKRRFNEEDYILSPVIIQNANRCIECKRCVRICEEVVGVGVLGSIGRGARTQETSFIREYLNCDHCGNCIEVCPVGSLMSRPYRYRSRPWDLDSADTVCTYCGTGCQLTVQSRNGEVVRVISKPDDGINNETLCARGRFGYSFINSHERLVTPMIKQSNMFEPVTWEDALKFIGDKLVGILKNGKRIGGVASSRLTNEELYLFQKMMREVLHTNYIDSSSRWDTNSMREFISVMEMDKGGTSIYDALRVDTIFIIGSAISDENPVTDYLIRRTYRDRQIKIIMASTRGVKLDKSALYSLRYRPGNEGRVIGGICKYIFEKEENELKELPFVDFFKKLSREEVVKSGADIGVIESIAETLRDSASITIALGTDVLRGPSGIGFLRILKDILRIMKKDVKLLPLFDRSNQRGAIDMGVLPGVLPGLEVKGEYVNGCKDILEAAAKGEMEALYIIGEDIINDYPDETLARKALKNVRFLIVQDIFLTDTARMANVVLPGASFAEKEGTYTNQEGRVQRLRRLLEPHGDSRADWEVISAIGETVDSSFNYRTLNEVTEEIKGKISLYSNIDFVSLNGDGQILNLTGRNTSISGEEAGDRGINLPSFVKDVEDPEYPFILITGNHLYHSGRLSMRADTLREILADAFVEISEQDARELGINEGDKVKVKGKTYEAIVPVRINNGSMKGVVFIPENFTDVPVNRFFSTGERFPRVNVISQTENSKIKMQKSK